MICKHYLEHYRSVLHSSPVYISFLAVSVILNGLTASRRTKRNYEASTSTKPTEGLILMKAALVIPHLKNHFLASGANKLHNSIGLDEALIM